MHDQSGTSSWKQRRRWYCRFGRSLGHTGFVSRPTRFRYWVVWRVELGSAPGGTFDKSELEGTRIHQKRALLKRGLGLGKRPMLPLWSVEPDSSSGVFLPFVGPLLPVSVWWGVGMHNSCALPCESGEASGTCAWPTILFRCESGEEEATVGEWVVRTVCGTTRSTLLISKN